jgi:hypothetical protein
MRGDNSLINIKHKSTGEVRRLKRRKATPLVASNVWGYISNSEYKLIRGKAKAEPVVSPSVEVEIDVKKEVPNKKSHSSNQRKARN